MARFQLNLPAPTSNTGAANQLLISSQDRLQQALGGINKTVEDAQAGIVKNNTNALIADIQSKLTPEQALDPKYQQELVGRLSQMAPDQVDRAGVMNALTKQATDVVATQKQRADQASQPFMQAFELARINNDTVGMKKAAAGLQAIPGANLTPLANATVQDRNTAFDQKIAQGQLGVQRRNSDTQASSAESEDRARRANTLYTGLTTKNALGAGTIYDTAEGAVTVDPNQNSKQAIDRVLGLGGDKLTERYTNPVVTERMQTYKPVIASVGAKYGIEPNLLASLLITESNLDPNAPAGSKSNNNMAQMIQKTAKAMGYTSQQLRDNPELAIDAAGKYLNSIQKNNPKLSTAQVVQAYHDGEGFTGVSKDPTYAQRIMAGAGILGKRTVTSTADLPEGATLAIPAAEAKAMKSGTDIKQSQIQTKAAIDTLNPPSMAAILTAGEDANIDGLAKQLLRNAPTEQNVRGKDGKAILDGNKQRKSLLIGLTPEEIVNAALTASAESKRANTFPNWMTINSSGGASDSGVEFNKQLVLAHNRAKTTAALRLQQEQSEAVNKAMGKGYGGANSRRVLGIN